MYLSRIWLDVSRRETARALASPQVFHGAIEKSFAGERVRNLWRLDQLNGTCCMLVLSKEKPDFSAVKEQFGSKEQQPGWETKDYDPLLARILPGESWRFRLCANPVRSVSSPGETGTRGKVYAHVTPAQQKEWLLSRAQAHGFALEEDGFDVVHSHWYQFQKGDGGGQVTLRAVVFEGTLSVTDGALFQKTLTEGLGRGKAYGCGLLTVSRQ